MLNLTYFSPKVEKRASLINGRGLFATAAIAKGEVVVAKGGYIPTREQRDSIGEGLGPSEIQNKRPLYRSHNAGRTRGWHDAPQPLLRSQT